MVVAAGRSAGDDRPAAPRHEDAGREGLPTGMFIDDVGILSPRELPDARAKAAHLLRIHLIATPELETLGLSVDHPVATQLADDLGAMRARHDPHRIGATVQG